MRKIQNNDIHGVNVVYVKFKLNYLSKTLAFWKYLFCSYISKPQIEYDQYSIINNQISNRNIKYFIPNSKN